MASSREMNTWNEQWRSSPLYAEALTSVGANASGPLKLSDRQRKDLKAFVEQRMGTAFPKGAEIDASGNMNEDEGFSKHKKWMIPAAIGASMFIPGVGPAVSSALKSVGGTLGGLGGGGGAAGLTAPSVSSAAGAANLASITGTGLTGAATQGANMGWGSLFGGIGRMFSGGAQASASNRGSEIEALLAEEAARQNSSRGYNADTLAREAGGRAQRNDAWKQLMQSNYVRDWKPTTSSFSPYSRPLTGPSDEMRAAASTRADDAMPRIAGNELPNIDRPKPFTLDPKLLKGSMWERLMGGIGAGMEGASGLRTLAGRS